MFFPIPFPNKNRNYILNVVHFEVILIVIENTSIFSQPAVIGNLKTNISKAYYKILAKNLHERYIVPCKYKVIKM
jgi:single-stranded DNA-specific DHH superfamily exonuclease